MNCACGDPSCGYCQAARSQYMNTLYNFDDFIPVDPCNAPLTTILEENEDDYVRDENQNGDEDDEEDDDDYYVEDESSEIVMPQQTGISLNRLNDLQVSCVMEIKYDTGKQNYKFFIGRCDDPVL